jgi:hypothetical protein
MSESGPAVNTSTSSTTENDHQMPDSPQFEADVALITEGIRSAYTSMEQRLGHANQCVDAVYPLLQRIEAAVSGVEDDIVAMAAWMFLLLTIKRKFDRGEMVPLRKPS